MVIIKSLLWTRGRIFFRTIVSCCNVTWCPVMHRSWLIAGCKVEFVFDQRVRPDKYIKINGPSNNEIFKREGNLAILWFHDVFCVSCLCFNLVPDRQGASHRDIKFAGGWWCLIMFNFQGDSTYAITKSGLLCEFNNRRLLDKWVELRTTR